MLDTEYLGRLLKILKEQGVSRFKTADVELSFVHATQKIIEQATPPPVFEKTDEGQLPVDLRSDAISDFDKVLNWSASPDPNDIKPTPGTDDVPLTQVNG
jgi:hypothetical protein